MQQCLVDFFLALRRYIDVGAGLVGGFRDATALYRDLKFAEVWASVVPVLAEPDGVGLSPGALP